MFCLHVTLYEFMIVRLKSTFVVEPISSKEIDRWSSQSVTLSVFASEELVMLDRNPTLFWLYLSRELFRATFHHSHRLRIKIPDNSVSFCDYQLDPRRLYVAKNFDQWNDVFKTQLKDLWKVFFIRFSLACSIDYLTAGLATRVKK